MSYSYVCKKRWPVNWGGGYGRDYSPTHTDSCLEKKNSKEEFQPLLGPTFTIDFTRARAFEAFKLFFRKASSDMIEAKKYTFLKASLVL